MKKEREIEFCTQDLGRNITRVNATQNIIGLLFNEYYNKEKDFGKNEKLVTELQRNLDILGYHLGDSGEKGNGVDGDLGVKTKTVIGNFEQDHSKDIKSMAEQKEQVQEAVKGRVR